MSPRRGRGAERGRFRSEAHETLSEPAPEASGRRLLLRDDLYTPPEGFVEKDETREIPARAADGSSDGDSVTITVPDDGSRESDGD